MAQAGMSAVLWSEAPDEASFAFTRDGRSLLETHVQSLRRAHIRDIAIVQAAGDAAPSQRLGDVNLVLMPDAWFTPFDSLITGIFAIDHRRPILVMPADHDLVSDETLSRLVNEAMRPQVTHALIPTFHNQRGYPVVLFPEGVDALVREAANPQGARELADVLSRWTGGVRDFAVTDHAVTQDYAARA